LERKLVEEGGPGWGTFSLLDRFLIAGRAVWFYLAKTLVPIKLSFLYPRWSIDAHSWLQHLYPLSVIVLGVVFFAARRRIGRAPLAAFLFFCGTLFPVLGFFDFFYMMMSFVADRFLYIPSLGVIALVVGGAARGLKRMKPAAARTGPVLAFVVIAVLGSAVWQRVHCFRTPETLYRDVVTKYPESWLGHYNLGCILAGAKRSDEAIQHLEKALSMKTNYPAIRGDLAAVYAEVGRVGDAIPLFNDALRQNPNDVNILTNFGAMFVGTGKYDEGITQYKKALRIDPRYAPALRNLTRIVAFRIDGLFKEGRKEEARSFAEDSRAFAVRIGATDLVRQIDDLVRANVTPGE
jgi:tetratricopeptide (TPR) repeat protein